MNGYLRQSTASQARLIGPFIDDVDFKTAKTALTIANTDIKLRANGITLSNKNSGGGTHQVNGMYSLLFDATDTGNVGELAFSVVVAGALPVFGTYIVLEEVVYDALFAPDAAGYIADQPVNATKIGGTLQTGRDLGTSVLLSSGTGTGQVDLSSGKVLLQATQTGVTIPTVTSVTNGVTVTANNDKTGYALSTAGVKAIWDQLTSALTTAGSIGKKLTDWVLGSDNKSLLSTDTQAGVTIPTVTTLTNAPSDSSGVTTLLSRLSALRAGYLDNLSAGAAALESSLQSLITTVGAAGAGLTATASAVWSVATRVLTAGTNIVLAKGTGITGFNDLSAAQVNAEVDTALADYDGPTHTELTSGLATADDATLTAIGSLNNLSQADVRTAVGLASANLDTQLGAIDSKTTNLPADPAAASDIPSPETIISGVRSALIPFPSTPVLDDANRADEGPPPSSNWTTGVGLNGELLTTGHRIVSNQFRRQSGGLPECESYWGERQFEPNCEVYLTAATTGFSQIRLGLRLADIGDSTLNGYYAYVHGSDNYQIGKMVNGSLTMLADLVSLPTIAAGNKYGFRAIGASLQLWADTGTGWTLVLEVSDSTFNNAGYIGIYTESSSVAAFDDFGGGNTVLPLQGIVDAVWDEDIVSAHQTDDTAGKKLSQALILYEGS